MIRVIDIVFSLIGILVFSPLLLIISVLILLDSPGGVLFKQRRVGKRGKDFILYKFRTMYKDSGKKGLLTVSSNDKKITGIGYFLRKYKLDELPQLINVLKGDMSIVGPRPEVRKYVNFYDEEQKEILNVRPGITDLASLVYFNENDILEDLEEPEKYYIDHIMPHKIELNMKFKNNPSLSNYFRVIFRTLCTIIK
ncbi:MAG: sugar transferase [Bacteroidales bacterium]|nr:sugar transferase [Bacteroidales bacterium]